MKRVLLEVEGATEQAVVQKVLVPYFITQDIYLSPRLVGTPGHKGGTKKWEAYRKEIANLLSGDSNQIVSTMVDFYGLPSGWPGKQSLAPRLGPEAKANRVEEAMARDFKEFCPELSRRFVPYIQMHELEALLFVDPERTAAALGSPECAEELRRIKTLSGNCEAINDGNDTAPSKRIESLFPRYRKGASDLADAHRILAEIPMETLMKECPLFGRWIERLIETANKVL